MNAQRARIGHGLVAIVALVALVWQLQLVITGASVLVPEARPELAVRLARFVSYFTVLSNLLVLVTEAVLARDPAHDGPSWRLVRMCSLVGITVTGIVHYVALRPLLNLTGASWVVDKLLHVVVPILAVAAWLLLGPRRQTSLPLAVSAVGWPLLWGVVTLIRGSLTGWWPYPFIDVDTHGWGRVGVNLLGVLVVFIVVGAALVGLDRWLGQRSEANRARYPG